jgi:hypothetical protein
MKFLSLGVIASAFAVVCVSGNRFSRSETGLSGLDMVVSPQGQLGNVPASALIKKSRLSRRKLADTIGIQGYQFVKRNEKAESDANEPEDHEGDENEITGNEPNEQSLVSLAAVSADKSENEPNENELKENEPNENELKENEPNENELKENEPNENELKENEPNENELKENEPNENELKENERDENEVTGNEPNESGIKKQGPKENDTGAVQQDVQKSKAGKKEVTEEASTGSKSVQPEANESKDGSNNSVDEQEQEASEPVINELGMVSGLYGNESEDDLVYYGLKDPMSNDSEQDDAENIARVFQSPQEDLSVDDIPYIYDDASEADPSEQVKDTELVNIDAGPNAESKPPKALQNTPAYSVSEHEVSADDNDEFESLQDRMEAEQGNKKNSIKENHV